MHFSQCFYAETRQEEDKRLKWTMNVNDFFFLCSKNVFNHCSCRLYSLKDWHARPSHTLAAAAAAFRAANDSKAPISSFYFIYIFSIKDTNQLSIYHPQLDEIPSAAMTACSNLSICFGRWRGKMSMQFFFLVRWQCWMWRWRFSSSKSRAGGGATDCGTPHFAWVLLGKSQPLLGMGTGEDKYWLHALCLWLFASLSTSLADCNRKFPPSSAGG